MTSAHPRALRCLQPHRFARMSRPVAAVAALLLCTAAPAAAETLRVETAGEAAASDAAARTQALDAAFAEAVSRALETLLPAAARQRHQAALVEQVVRRARLYIGSYKVEDEVRRGDMLRVRITARVDLDGLRDRLAELGIAGGSQPGPARPAASASTTSSSGRAALVLAATVDGETYATFGHAGGDGGPAGRALAQRLRAQGLDLVSLDGMRTATAREPAQGLPLDDADAAFLAQDAGAGVAFVIAAELGQPGLVRGTTLHGVTARAAIRVLDVTGPEPQQVAAARVTTGGFAATATDALAAAADDLARRLTAAVADDMNAYWPPSVTADGGLLITVQGFSGWQNVDALLDHLSHTPGIRRAWPRKLGAHGVVLAVDTDMSRRRVASTLRLATLPSARLELASNGDGILVILHEQAAPATDEGVDTSTGARP